MNEYQQFASAKALAFIQMLEELGKSNSDVLKILIAMRPNVEKIIQGKEQLPTRLLNGWSIYFSPEIYNGVYEKYPNIVNAEAELSWILSHPSMESYLESRRYLESL